MNTVPICSISILVFGVLMIIGGIIGFKKAKSVPSLVAGVVSGIALAYCYWLSQTSPLLSFKLAFVMLGALDGVFLMRLVRTKKFMPSGMLLILCILEQIEIYSTMSI